MTDWNFNNKIVILTGGASGIGRNTAIEFAKAKANVIILDVNEIKAMETIESIKNYGDNAFFYKVDITNEEEVKNAVNQVNTQFKKIDILVNCAGFQAGPKNFWKTRNKEWDKEIAINLYGVLISTKWVVKTMIKNKTPGRIINISSDGGRIGEKMMCVYSAAKGAVQSFSKALATEVGEFGITVNAICPGATDTPLTSIFFKDENLVKKVTRRYPMGRLGTPPDISNGILFLASDESSWITGQVISISGGFTMC